MMGPEYFTVGAYITDGDVLCRDCGEKAKLPTSDSISLAQVWESWGSDEYGCYCGQCGEEICEPYVEDDLKTETDNDEDLE